MTAPDTAPAYVSEGKIYPRSVTGGLQHLRLAALAWLLGMFYLGPWLRWDGRQAVLFDLPARRFHVFSLTFWPQDFVFLALLLVIAALALFFFTALAGRLWCGYACPQTVWTSAFLHMEQWTEGDRSQRMRLDAGPWTREKLLRKSAKHVLWGVFALWTGFTFVGFFTPVADLALRLPTLQWGGWETFWVLFYSLATWGNAGFLREQVCKYMCPYARFQSAMFDRNTLLIAYDPMRGEPRGARSRHLQSVLERSRGLLARDLAADLVVRAAQNPLSASHRSGARGTITFDAAAAATPLPSVAPADLGDCVDCTICVQVCPTGIDIRNGLQYECIACGACVDACNQVMARIGYPAGLIRHSTQNAIDGKPSRILRPRIVVYASLLVALLAAWAWGVAHRGTFIAELLRDRNALYTLEGAQVENHYTLKIVNKTDAPASFRLVLEDAPAGATLNPRDAVDAAPGEVLAVPVEVTATGATGRQGLRLRIDASDGSSRHIDSSFFGPGHE